MNLPEHKGRNNKYKSIAYFVTVPKLRRSLTYSII